MNRTSALLLTVIAVTLSGCQAGVPEIWPKSFAEYQTFTEAQKLEIKANCAKHGDPMKGIPLPSCWLSQPKMCLVADGSCEKQYAMKLREWDAYKNAQ